MNLDEKLDRHFASKFDEWDGSYLVQQTMLELLREGRRKEHPLVGFAKLVELGCRSIFDDLARYIEWAQSKTESPIETLLFYALACEGYSGLNSVFFRFEGKEWGIEWGGDRLCIAPQATIGDYRVDFQLEGVITYHTVDEKMKEHSHPLSSFLVLECDGHAFHEKTKEQAARDKQRDRNLQMCGFPVFRFTGSEIWRDPLKCAQQSLQKLFDDVHAKIPKDGSP